MIKPVARCDWFNMTQGMEMFQRVREDELIDKLQGMVKREKNREQINLLEKMIADLKRQEQERPMSRP